MVMLAMTMGQQRGRHDRCEAGQEKQTRPDVTMSSPAGERGVASKEKGHGEKEPFHAQIMDPVRHKNRRRRHEDSRGGAMDGARRTRPQSDLLTAGAHSRNIIAEHLLEAEGLFLGKGGALERIRTSDPQLRKLVLYPLSYERERQDDTSEVHRAYRATSENSKPQSRGFGIKCTLACKQCAL